MKLAEILLTIGAIILVVDLAVFSVSNFLLFQSISKQPEIIRQAVSEGVYNGYEAAIKDFEVAE